ncbi:MAG: hypothetical protein AAF797_13140 [Planctomycetota bacterium]
MLGAWAGWGRSQATGLKGRWLSVGVLALALAGLVWVSVAELRGQTVSAVVEGQRVRLLPGELVGAWGEAGEGLRASPVERSGPDALGGVLVLGGNGGLLNLPGELELIYASAFDRHPWGRWWGEASVASGEDVGVLRELMAERLRAAGVGRVWVEFGELERLRRTYGVDAGLEPERVAGVVRGWRVVQQTGSGVVVEVPAEQ